jgi:signal transduction histidine kinase
VPTKPAVQKRTFILNFQHRLETGPMTKHAKFFAFVFLFLTSSPPLIGQRKNPDSLRNKYHVLRSQPGFKETDTAYINTLYAISYGTGREYRDSSRLMALKTISLAKEANYPKGEALGNYALALVHLLDGDPEKSIQLAQAAQRIAQKGEEIGIQLRAYNAKGIAFRQLQKLDSSFLNYYKGLLLAEEMGNNKHQYAFHTNLGYLFLNNRNYGEALSHFKSAHDKVRFFEDLNHHLSLDLSIAQLFNFQNESDSTASYLLKARRWIDQDIGYPRERSNYWNLKGEYHYKLNQLELADQAFKTSIDLTSELNEPNQFVAYLGLAQTAFLKGNYALAEQFGHTALALDKGQELNPDAELLRKLMAQIYQRLGQQDSAQYYMTQYQKMYNHSKKSIMGRSIAMLQARESAKTNELLTQNRERQQALTDNRLKWFWLFICVVGVILIVLFVRSYSQYKKQAVQLNRISQEKDELFTILGHDLRSPLNTLQELLQLYQEPLANKAFLDNHLSNLQRRVFYSKETLDNMMHWVQEQLSDAKPAKKQIDMEDLVPKCIAGVYEIAENKKMSISFKSDPEARLFADPIHLEIVVNNLLLNAIKFSEVGQPIQLEWKESGPYKKLIIRDHGIGLSDEQIGLFQREGKLQTRKGTSGESGLGIGITICSKLMELNKGELLIFQKDKGTEVQLLFSKDSQ